MSIMWYQIAIGSGLAAQANFFLWHVQLYLDNYFLANLLWLGLLGLEIGFLVFSECGDVKAGTPSPIPDVDDYIYFANCNYSIWSTAEVRVPFVRRHRFISWNVGPRKLFHKLVPLVSVLAKLKRWGAQGLPQGAPSPCFPHGLVKTQLHFLQLRITSTSQPLQNSCLCLQQ
jgi:hypothetical protein